MKDGKVMYLQFLEGDSVIEFDEKVDIAGTAG